MKMRGRQQVAAKARAAMYKTAMYKIAEARTEMRMWILARNKDKLALRQRKANAISPKKKKPRHDDSVS